VTSKKPLIAIVDDDESVCRALERLVRSLGMYDPTADCLRGIYYQATLRRQFEVFFEKLK